MSLSVCSFPRADVGDVVSRGEVRGGPTSEASGEAEAEPKGPAGDVTSPAHTPETSVM